MTYSKSLREALVAEGPLYTTPYPPDLTSVRFERWLPAPFAVEACQRVISSKRYRAVSDQLTATMGVKGGAWQLMAEQYTPSVVVKVTSGYGLKNLVLGTHGRLRARLLWKGNYYERVGTLLSDLTTALEGETLPPNEWDAKRLLKSAVHLVVEGKVGTRKSGMWREMSRVELAPGYKADPGLWRVQIRSIPA